MKKCMKSISLAAVMALVLTSVPVMNSVQTVSAASYNILLDGKVLNTNNPVKNMNDRILLPFREIGEAMGADITWWPADSQILAFRGNRYSRMFIGNQSVTYGVYSLDSDGEAQYVTSNIYTLDVAPTIIDDRTYIPVRAIAETLGATVEWNGQTGTAIITSGEIKEPEVEKKPDNYADFSNTSFFRIMSSAAVENMYEDSNNKPFIFVLYDSSEESSKMLVPNIQDVAQDAAYRIYGVDMNDKNNDEDDYEWLWDFFRENNFKSPTLYSVYSTSKVEHMQAPSNMEDIKDQITRFSAQAETDIDYGDFDNTTYFKTKTASFISDEYDDESEFIVVLYDATDDNSKNYIPYIKAAASDKKQLVYGLDINQYPKFYNTVEFMEDYQYNSSKSLPIMFLVYEDHDDIQVYKKPTTLALAKAHIEEFVAYATNATASFSDISSTSYYENADITDLQAKYKADDSFIIFLYDSSDDDYTKSSITDMISRMDSNMASGEKDVYYGVNLASTVYNANTKTSNYSWLLNDSKTPSNLLTKTPALIYVKNGAVNAYQTRITKAATAGSFITNNAGK